MYEKQGFFSGQALKASQLNTMEEGIVEAQKTSSNVEMGTGTESVQQKPRMEKMTTPTSTGKFYLKFPADQNPGVEMATKQPYGATGAHSASFCGRSSAQGKHSMAIGNSTVATGEESFSQGYASVAAGASAFAGGSGTYAQGEAAVSSGLQTQALGNYSYAGGARTVASGELSQTTGIDTIAEGYASSANGQGTVADQNAQFVVGRYNVPREGSVFQVGAGNSVDEKITGLDVLQGGEVIIYWNDNYYSLNLILNIISNMLGGSSAFDDAKK